MNSHSCDVEALPAYADKEAFPPEFLHHLELAAKKLSLTRGLLLFSMDLS